MPENGNAGTGPGGQPCEKQWWRGASSSQCSRRDAECVLDFCLGARTLDLTVVAERVRRGENSVSEIPH